jgi:hypothetical protein
MCVQLYTPTKYKIYLDSRGSWPWNNYGWTQLLAMHGIRIVVATSAKHGAGRDVFLPLGPITSLDQLIMLWNAVFYDEML